MRTETGAGGRSPRLYGISEIAAALGVTPRLVASWRQRGSHGLPEPDANLASGAVWFAETIEPWLARYKIGREPDARAAAEATIRKVARRSYRLAALVNEEPSVRENAIAQTLGDLLRAADEMQQLMQGPEPTVLGGSALKLLDSLTSAIRGINARADWADLGAREPGADLAGYDLDTLRQDVSSQLIPSVTRVVQLLDRTPQHWRPELAE